jgi:hypothetical protein
MSQIQELAYLSVDTAEAVARNSEVFDAQAADLTLRNMAVMADRLKPNDFYSLGSSILDQVLVVVHVAQDIAPLMEEDTKRYLDETDQEHQYRVNVWQPIHSLQTKVHNRAYDKDDSTEMSKIRFGVEASGRAFMSVLLETKSIPEIAETEQYFWGNVTAAARRVNLSSNGII